MIVALHGFVPALAGGTVVALSEPDAAGRYHVTQQTLLAERVRAGVGVPLEQGMELADGDEIRSTGARVEVRLDDGWGTLHLQEDTSATIAPGSVLQVLGDLFYRVHGTFRVRYATVEAVVEGTRFRVAAEGTDAVRVEVDAHKVRVSNLGKDVLVESGHFVIVPLNGPPGEVQEWARSERADVWFGSWPISRPRLKLGVQGGGGLLRQGPSAGGRAFARLAASPWLDLELDAGGLPAPGGGAFLPVSGSVAWSIHAAGVDFGLGGRGTAAFEWCDCAAGREFAALHLGGAALGRTSVPLSRRFTVEGTVEVGYTGDLDATGWVGLGVGL